MFEQQRMAMVDGQLRTNKITEPSLIDLFLTAPREEFVPDSHRGSAYVDEDIDLGKGRVLLEPLVAARLLQAASLVGGEAVLVIGGGNGYMPRLLCDLGCNVTVMEPIGEFADLGQEKAPEAHWLRQGFGEFPSGKFDLIFVCGSLLKIPSAWADHLNEGGQVLAPISGVSGNDGRLVVAQQTNQGFSVRTIANASVPVLPELVSAPMFQF